MKLSPNSASAGIEGMASDLVYCLTRAADVADPAVREHLLRRAERRALKALAWSRILVAARARPAGRRMDNYPGAIPSSLMQEVA